MIFDEHDLANAVYIFSEQRELIRELNYAEFEALLDNYVPAVDLANRELNAVYVELDSDYHIRSTVFFLVRFNSQGFIERNWSVPLFLLAQQAPPGPDLGNGPIGLVCASQCPVDYLENVLWNPDLRTKREFKALIEAVNRNRIAIYFHEADPDEKRRKVDEKKNNERIEKLVSTRLRKQFDKEMRDKMAQAIREERLKATTSGRDHDATIDALKREHNERLENFRLLLEDRESLLREEKGRNERLKETIDGQAEKIQGLREYFEFKVEQAESVEKDQLEELKRSHKLELASAVEAGTKELKELLQMRDVEISYRNEQEARLQTEIRELRDENSDLVNNSGDELLSKMLEKGISFVTYQPGAGHITLPLSDVSRYMENPTAYVAEHCGVSEAHYNAWLDHYHVPICQASDVDATICGENINRIETPADFIVGESDCCFKHRVNKTPRLKIAGGKQEP